MRALLCCLIAVLSGLCPVPASHAQSAQICTFPDGHRLLTNTPCPTRAPRPPQSLSGESATPPPREFFADALRRYCDRSPGRCRCSSPVGPAPCEGESP